MGGVLIMLILTRFSVGISIDPILWGLDLRIGKDDGFKFKIISGFYLWKRHVDSSQYIYPGKEVYHNEFLRTNYWYGVEGRAEYYFRSEIGIQPYTGFGLGYYRKNEWDISWEGKDSLWIYYPLKSESYYSGVVSAIGCELYPFLLLSNLLKIDKKKSGIISFNFEFDLYYKFFHHFERKVFWEEPEISGILLGAGIRINF